MASRKVINSPVDVTAKTIVAAAIGSGAATVGQALEADGAGGASWQSLSGTPGLDQVLTVSNVSNHDIVPNTDAHDTLGSTVKRFITGYFNNLAQDAARFISFVAGITINEGNVGGGINIAATTSGGTIIIQAGSGGSGGLTLASAIALGLNIPTQGTVGLTGAASVLPGLPVGYIKILISGVPYVIPYYNP